MHIIIHVHVYTEDTYTCIHSHVTVMHSQVHVIPKSMYMYMYMYIVHVTGCSGQGWSHMIIYPASCGNVHVHFLYSTCTSQYM